MDTYPLRRGRRLERSELVSSVIRYDILCGQLPFQSIGPIG